MIGQTMKRWTFRRLSAVLPIVIAFGMASSEARSDAFDNLAREVCYRVHGADAHSIRKFEQEGLFRVLRELKDNVEQNRQIAENKEKAYKLELGKVENMKADIAELQDMQRLNYLVADSAPKINDIAFEIAEEEDAYRKEKEAGKKGEIRSKIDALEARLEQLHSDFVKKLTTEVGEKPRSRYFDMVETELDDPYWAEEWSAGLRVTEHKIKEKIQSDLAKANSAYKVAQEDAVPVLESYSAALDELNQSVDLLEVMERLIRETEACRADAKNVAPRRDFVANFKVSCRSPEFDAPACAHGTMWINFDAQGRAIGQAGFSRVCASGSEGRECLNVPTAQVTQVTGQIAANTLTATVTYMLPSNRPRKDTGNFRYEGQVTPDGNIMPIAWRGTGSLTNTENKYPLPPNKPYVINCSGQWTTEGVPACWDE